MYFYEEKLFDVIDMNKAKSGEDELSYVDETVTMTFIRHVTDDESYFAYLGIKHRKIDDRLYHSTLRIILYDKKSDSYICTEADCNMYTGLKTLVFKDLYKHLYMTNINFNDAFDEELDQDCECNPDNCPTNTNKCC